MSRPTDFYAPLDEALRQVEADKRETDIEHTAEQEQAIEAGSIGDAPEVMRMYRGIGHNMWQAEPGDAVSFTSDPADAALYGRVHYVDVTPAEMAKFERLPEQLFDDEWRSSDPDIIARLKLVGPEMTPAEQRAQVQAVMFDMADANSLVSIERQESGGFALMRNYEIGEGFDGDRDFQPQRTLIEAWAPTLNELHSKILVLGGLDEPQQIQPPSELNRDAASEIQAPPRPTEARPLDYYAPLDEALQQVRADITADLSAVAEPEPSTGREHTEAAPDVSDKVEPAMHRMANSYSWVEIVPAESGGFSLMRNYEVEEDLDGRPVPETQQEFWAPTLNELHDKIIAFDERYPPREFQPLEPENTTPPPEKSAEVDAGEELFVAQPERPSELAVEPQFDDPLTEALAQVKADITARASPNAEYEALAAELDRPDGHYVYNCPESQSMAPQQTWAYYRDKIINQNRTADPIIEHEAGLADERVEVSSETPRDQTSPEPAVADNSHEHDQPEITVELEPEFDFGMGGRDMGGGLGD
jgi:hypothetical protein